MTFIPVLQGRKIRNLLIITRRLYIVILCTLILVVYYYYTYCTVHAHQSFELIEKIINLRIALCNINTDIVLLFFLYQIQQSIIMYNHHTSYTMHNTIIIINQIYYFNSSNPILFCISLLFRSSHTQPKFN